MAWSWSRAIRHRHLLVFTSEAADELFDFIQFNFSFAPRMLQRKILTAEASARASDLCMYPLLVVIRIVPCLTVFPVPATICLFPNHGK